MSPAQAFYSTFSFTVWGLSVESVKPRLTQPFFGSPVGKFHSFWPETSLPCILDYLS